MDSARATLLRCHTSSGHVTRAFSPDLYGAFLADVPGWVLSPRLTCSGLLLTSGAGHSCTGHGVGRGCIMYVRSAQRAQLGHEMEAHDALLEVRSGSLIFCFGAPVSSYRYSWICLLLWRFVISSGCKSSLRYTCFFNTAVTRRFH